MPLVWLLLSLLLAGCGGRAPASATPDPGPALAVTAFMDAVADSNLARMAELWGTRRGPAGRTGFPNDYERRLQVIHAYLRGTTAKVLSPIQRERDRVVLAVAISRSDCTRQVPFTVIRISGDRWIVNAVDIAVAGTPGRPCAVEDRPPTRPPGPSQPGALPG